MPRWSPTSDTATPRPDSRTRSDDLGDDADAGEALPLPRHQQHACVAADVATGRVTGMPGKTTASSNGTSLSLLMVWGAPLTGGEARLASRTQVRSRRIAAGVRLRALRPGRRVRESPPHLR